MSSTKFLCSCGCGRQVTGATERTHLEGRGPSNIVSAAVLDNIYLRGLDTEMSSPSESIPHRKRRRLKPPLQTGGQRATQRPSNVSEPPFTGGTDSDRVEGNSSLT